MSRWSGLSCDSDRSSPRTANSPPRWKSLSANLPPQGSRGSVVSTGGGSGGIVVDGGSSGVGLDGGGDRDLDAGSNGQTSSATGRAGGGECQRAECGP